MGKLAILLKGVDASPFDQNIWTSVLSFLDSSPQEAMQESSTLRTYLDRYVESFLTGSDYWMKRFAYEKECLESSKTSKRKQDLALIRTVYTAGMRECPSWKVALQCVKDAEEFMEDDSLLALMEEALEVCGKDVTAGGLLWEKRFEFEADRLEDRCSSENLATADVQQAIEAAKPFFEVLSRLLSQPVVIIERALATMENTCNMIFDTEDRIKAAAEAFELEALSNKATLALQERELLADFEGKVAAFETPPEGEGEDEGDGRKCCMTLEQLSEMVELWSCYAKHEVERGRPARAQRVYQRAVLCVHEQAAVLATSDEGTATAEARPIISSLWISYTNHVMSDIPTCQRVSKLGLKACYYCRELWELHFLSLERDAAVDLQRLWASHSTALQSGLSTAADYSAVLISFPATLGRLVRRQEHHQGQGRKRPRSGGEASSGSASTGTAARLEGWEKLAKEARQQSEEWLCNYYPAWDDIWVAWALAWAAVPAADSDGDARVKEVVGGVLDRFPTTRHMDSLVEELRKVDMLAARTALDRAVQEQALVLQSAESTPATAVSLTTFLDLRERLDRLHGDTDDYVACLKATTEVRERCKAQLTGKKERKEEKGGEAILKAKPNTKAKKSKKKKKEKVEDETAMQVQGDGDTEREGDNNGKEEPSDTLRMRNLPFEATEAEIEELLQHRAKVRLARAYSGRSKGIAYAAFTETSDCRLIARAGNLELQGRPVQVEQLSKPSLEQILQELDAPQPTTVNVSGLPALYTAEHVLTLFSHCGDIVEAVVTKEPGDKDKRVNATLRAQVQFTNVAGREKAFDLHKLDVPISDSTKTRLQVSICKHPLVAVTDPAPAVKRAKTSTMEVPYVPPPIVEIKAKPKRAGFMFKPAALR